MRPTCKYAISLIPRLPDLFQCMQELEKIGEPGDEASTPHRENKADYIQLSAPFITVMPSDEFPNERVRPSADGLVVPVSDSCYLCATGLPYFTYT